MEAILRLELLLSILEQRAKEMRDKSRTHVAKDAFGRGHYSGWAAATEADIDHLRPILDELRAEAAEEPFNSYAEKAAS